MKNQRVVLDNRAIDKLLSKPEAHSPVSESSLVGACLIDPAVIDEVIDIVPSGSMFYNFECGTVYEEMLRLHSQGPMDASVLVQSLHDSGKLELVGGADFIIGLAGAVYTTATAPYHAKVIADKARMRALATAGATILHELDSDGATGTATTERAERLIAEVADGACAYKSIPIAEVMGECIDLTTRWQDGELCAIPTGIGSLDTIIAGLRRQEVTIVAGRPSMGKSALSAQIARDIAARGTPTAIYSMEMRAASVGHRLICAESMLPLNWILNPRRHHLGVDEWRRIHEAAGRLAVMPLEIVQCAGATISSLRSMVRRSVKRNQVAVVMIDYLQLISDPVAKAISRRDEVASISRQIHEMAMETDTAVLCVAQLNRQSETGVVRRPRMSDLKESGDIEQDADTIILIHREAYYHKDDEAWMDANPDKHDSAELIIDKQRNGETGVAYTRWDGKYQTFRSDAA